LPNASVGAGSTRAKAEPLADLGATIIDTPAALGGCDIVFTIVAGPTDFRHVLLGPDGVLSGTSRPAVIVDSTTVSSEASADVRREAAARGSELLAAPVSGNPRVVETGRLTIVTSGPRQAHEIALPYLERMAATVTYVGDGEEARLVKVCHNLMLGVVAQCLAEITVLAEKGGVTRADFLAFLNESVMGSAFTRYKTPAYVNLDYTPMFTPPLLRKDFDLGFEAAGELGVPMPVAAAAGQVVQSLIGNGYTDVDFAALLELQARGSALELRPEEVEVSDGLSANGRMHGVAAT
jgi:3-hydroxyisobutyrate dehydrogenase